MKKFSLFLSLLALGVMGVAPIALARDSKAAKRAKRVSVRFTKPLFPDRGFVASDKWLEASGIRLQLAAESAITADAFPDLIIDQSLGNSPYSYSTGDTT